MLLEESLESGTRCNHHEGSLGYNLGVSKNSGTPKWMVKIMENRKIPIKIHDLVVLYPFFGGETPI